MPDPIALPTVTRSGVHPNDWKWNGQPVRPSPHWISSAINRVPVFLVTRAIAAANSGESGRTPPSPWIGSAITAAVWSVTAASSAPMSSGDTNVTPGISGPNGSR